jgi:hypothetical protein
MSARYEEVLKEAQDWAGRAVAGGWLPPAEARALESLEQGSPAALFEPGAHRPLVAAFFGGTGVGKSSLLNRLAGQAIARTGVERPTSREVSAYFHESVRLRGLPGDLPLEQVRIAQHQDERRRQVLWIDMPDFDSVDQHNRELVLEWLPHLDVLIYVVSPERYRDDKGWRLLKAHGGAHAWLFVINQWDRGHPLQYEDFAKLLAKGGFAEPVILRTDCREGVARREDDFADLEALLQQMADQHVLRQLEIRAEARRRAALQAAVRACLDRLGDAEGYGALEPLWRAAWDQAQDELLRGLEWPVQAVARAFVGREASPLRRPMDLARDAVPTAETAVPGSLLWDDWAAGRLRDALDGLVVEAGQLGLPALPLKSALDPLGAAGGRLVLNEGQRGLRQALAQPGNAVQRVLLKLTGGLAALLPLVAVSLVSYQVVKGYYESLAQHLDFLGADFAIHSGLLIALAWLLPFFLYRQLKPSAERVAVKGLRAGVARALDGLGEQGRAVLAQAEQARAEVVAEGRRIAERVAAAERPEAAPDSGLLRRVLPAAGSRR